MYEKRREKEMYCKNCGTELENGQTFCKNCGVSMEQDNKATASTPMKHEVPKLLVADM